MEHELVPHESVMLLFVRFAVAVTVGEVVAEHGVAAPPPQLSVLFACETDRLDVAVNEDGGHMALTVVSPVSSSVSSMVSTVPQLGQALKVYDLISETSYTSFCLT
jgi:hypothetical protein